jgi:hypothetical protein
MVIYVQNASKRISDDDANVMTEAVHQQLAIQVASSWGVNVPSLTFIGKSDPPMKTNVFVLNDDPPKDDDGIEGYHDLSSDGYIRGWVFASPSLDNKALSLEGPNSVASVLSHEVLEALRDPWANYWVDTYGKLVIDGVAYAQVAMEACDPVETDENIIQVLNKLITLSNFILPLWENPNGSGPMDYLTAVNPNRAGGLTQPFTRTDGGYVIVRNNVGDSQALFGSRYPEWKKELKLKKNKRSRTSKRVKK